MRKYIFIAAFFGLVLFFNTEAEEKIDFHEQIYPFVRSGCILCHMPEYQDERGRTRRPKGGYVLTDPQSIMESEGEHGEPFIVPGDPDASRMLQVTRLPLYDDMHFPPDGKAPQWTDAEKDLFAKWIEQGADFGDWEGEENPHENIPDWDGKEKEPGTIETWEE